MKMVFLSGGTGTPKLLMGFREVFPEEKITVIVNTAEDVWISGNKVCPDIDSVIYALSGKIDEKKWWGIENDTFTTHKMLKSIGFDEKLMIGDMDRAIHIFRSELLRKGYTLTETTEKLRKAFKIKAKILPMTEDDVSTWILTPEGEMHFQEFWVEKKGEPEVLDVVIKNIEKAEPTEMVKKSIKNADVVVIGPSNPVTSIGPIIWLKGVKEMLRSKFVISVSPFIGDKPFSGPAGKFMIAKGLKPDLSGLREFYRDIAGVFIVHEGESFNAPDVVKANIVMKTREDMKTLAEKIIEIARKSG